MSESAEAVEEALAAVDEPTADHYDRWVTFAGVLAAEVKRLRILLGDSPEHVIQITDDGWTIMHPIACRPDLFACPVNRAAGDRLKTPIGPNGRYVCSLEDGQFTIGRRVE
jgi:hypothetical protein